MRSESFVPIAARIGFAAKGLVYLILGWLALEAGLGTGGRVSSVRGVVRGLLDESYGPVLVLAIAVGLALYAGWRYLEAFADANDKGTDASGIGTRAAYAASGTVYGVLAIDAARLALSDGGGTGGGRETMIAGALGGWLVWVAGFVLIGYGAKQLRDAFSGKLSQRLQIGEAVRDAGPWLLHVSRVGIAARGIVFGILGVLLIRGSSRPDAASQTDTADSLRIISGLPQGELWLAAMGAGLMAYGVYQLLHARYRRINL